MDLKNVVAPDWQRLDARGVTAALACGMVAGITVSLAAANSQSRVGVLGFAGSSLALAAFVQLGEAELSRRGETVRVRVAGESIGLRQIARTAALAASSLWLLAGFSLVGLLLADLQTAGSSSRVLAGLAPAVVLVCGVAAYAAALRATQPPLVVVSTDGLSIGDRFVSRADMKGVIMARDGVAVLLGRESLLLPTCPSVRRALYDALKKLRDVPHSPVRRIGAALAFGRIDREAARARLEHLREIPADAHLVAALDTAIDGRTSAPELARITTRE